MATVQVFIALHPDLNSLGRRTLLFESADGGTYFSRMTARLRRCRSVSDIALSLPQGTELPQQAQIDVPLLIGPGYGVLERIVHRGMECGASTIMRINGDAAWPLPASLDSMVAAHLAEAADITLGEYFPGCTGIDLLSCKALEEALTLGTELAQLRRPMELIGRLPNRLQLHSACRRRGGGTSPLERFMLVDAHSMELHHRLVVKERLGSADVPQDIARERLGHERERAELRIRRAGRRMEKTGVLLINNVARIGGAENSMFLLVRELQRRGNYRPVVLLFEDGELSERYRRIGIPCEHAAPPHGYDSAILMNSEFDHKLAGIIRQYDIAIAHSNSITANGQSIRSLLALGLPCLSHVRDPVAGADRLHQFSLHLPQRLIAVSEFIAASLASASLGVMAVGRDIFPIHNGIDFAQFDAEMTSGAGIRSELGLPAGATLIGSLSQVNAWKGQDILIQAVEPLLRKYRDLYLAIVGSATVNPAQMAFVHQLHNTVAERNLRERIFFLGQRPGAAAILNEFDIFAHIPTGDDPFPRVVIEAMAAGVAIVGSRSGGITEALDDGRLGDLVPMGDVRQTTASLEGMLLDPERRKRLGGAAARHARASFTIERHAQAIEAVYHGILAEPAP